MHQNIIRWKTLQMFYEATACSRHLSIILQFSEIAQEKAQ